MTNQELFEKLKRDGECWHEFLPYSNNPIEYPNSEKCLKCGEEFSIVLTVFGKLNPDFSTPDGFFWLWERARKKDWWSDFRSKIMTHKLHFHSGMWDFNDYLIHSTRLTEALKEYLDGKD